MLGIDPHNSFFGRLIDGINLTLIYFLAIFSFMVDFLIRKNNNFLYKILLSSFLSSILVSFFAYTDTYLFSIFKNGSSTIGNSSYTGSYLLFNIFFGLILFINYSKIWKKIFIGFGILFIVFSPLFFNLNIFLGKILLNDIVNNPFILLGFSNAAILGVFVSFFVIIFLSIINFSSKIFIKILGLILFLSLLCSLFFVAINIKKPNSYFNNIYIDLKGENRLIAWDIASISSAQNPFLGVGFNNFSYSYQKYFTADIFRSKNIETSFNQPHNVVWEYASNNGFIGLVSFLSLLFFIFISFFNYKESDNYKDKIIRIIFIGILFGYFFQNLFGFDTPITYLMLFLLIGIALSFNIKNYSLVLRNKYLIFCKYFIFILILLNIYFFYLFVFLPLKEFKVWGITSSGVDIKKRIVSLNKMQNISLFGGVFDNAFWAQKAFDVYNKNLNQIKKLEDKTLFFKEFDAVINQVKISQIKQPYEINSYVILNKLLNMKIVLKEDIDENIWNESLNNIQKAIEINNKNPDLYLLLAKTYILRKDFINARFSIKNAIILVPEYKNSYEYAKKILKLDYDKNFEDFINEMEDKYIKL